MTRFRSVCVSAIVAAMNIVSAPIPAPTAAAAGVISNSGHMRAMR